MSPAAGNGETVLVGDLATLTVKDSPAATEPPQLPPHLSHDPETNSKRSDPFQFGSRFLSQEDNVFEFNAWDHVETDDTYKEYAELQYTKQRQAPVSDFDKSKIFIIFLPPFFLGSPPRNLMIQNIVSLRLLATERNITANVFRSYLICILSIHLLYESSKKALLTSQKPDSTQTLQNGGTNFTRTIRRTSSKTVNGYSKNSPS